VVTGHNFESILPKDHPCHVCFKLADWFQKRRLLNNFPIGSYVRTYLCQVSDTGSPEPLVQMKYRNIHLAIVLFYRILQYVIDTFIIFILLFLMIEMCYIYFGAQCNSNVIT
jgi:hypothetical protein